jgi:antitoxin HicB
VLTVEEYVELPYTMALVHDRDDEGNAAWVAQVEELPGCVSQGPTPDEAVANLREAMQAWIGAALEAGREIPRPRAEARPSGRFLLRLPVSLHAALAREADAEGISLNQFIVGALAGAIGWRVPKTRRAEDPNVVVLGAGTAKSREFAVFSKSDLFDQPIEKLELDTKSTHRLNGAGIRTIGDAAKRLAERKAIPGVGAKTWDQVVESIKDYLADAVRR